MDDAGNLVLHDEAVENEEWDKATKEPEKPPEPPPAVEAPAAAPRAPQRQRNARESPRFQPGREAAASCPPCLITRSASQATT